MFTAIPNISPTSPRRLEFWVGLWLDQIQTSLSEKLTTTANIMVTSSKFYKQVSHCNRGKHYGDVIKVLQTGVRLSLPHMAKMTFWPPPPSSLGGWMVRAIALQSSMAAILLRPRLRSGLGHISMMEKLWLTSNYIPLVFIWFIPMVHVVMPAMPSNIIHNV